LADSGAGRYVSILGCKRLRGQWPASENNAVMAAKSKRAGQMLAEAASRRVRA